MSARFLMRHCLRMEVLASIWTMTTAVSQTTRLAVAVRCVLTAMLVSECLLALKDAIIAYLTSPPFKTFRSDFAHVESAV